MLCHLNLIPSFCFVLSNHYMPLYVLLCGPKIRNKYLVWTHYSNHWVIMAETRIFQYVLQSPRNEVLEKEDRIEELKKQQKNTAHPCRTCPTICQSSRTPLHWKLPSTIARPNHPLEAKIPAHYPRGRCSSMKKEKSINRKWYSSR